jgi:hypothetical protein
MLSRGMCGHSVGKCLLRRGRGPAQGGIHFWRDTVAGDWLPASTVEDGSLLLLHFDAISFAIWKEKLARRVAREVRMSGRAPHRQRQVEQFARLQLDESALEAFLQPLRCRCRLAPASVGRASMQCIELSANPSRNNA